MTNKAYVNKANSYYYICSAKFFTIIALLLITTMFLLSCSNPVQETDSTAADSTTSVSNDYYDNLERGPSGPLRLYWSTRKNLNPVLDQTYSGQAAYKLIYGSLLTKDEQGALTYDLAERIIWTEDGLNLIIMVKENQYYHDGSELQAADAALALSYVWSQYGGPAFNPEKFSNNDINNENEEQNSTEQTEVNTTETQTEQTNNVGDDADTVEETEAENEQTDDLNDFPQARSTADIFGSLQDIKVIDKYSFKCVFSEPAIEFASLLDFEIIPSAAWLNEDIWQVIPGTGRYRISSYDENGNVTLEPAEALDGGPDKIILIQYFDEAEAMQALEKDELDLVVLTPNSYSYYYTRNNLDLIRFTGSSSVFLTANTEGAPFNEPETLLDIKKIMQSANLRTITNLWPGELSDFPLPDSSFMIDHELSDLSKIIGNPPPIKIIANKPETTLDDYTEETIGDSDEVDKESSDNIANVADDSLIFRMVAPNQDHLKATAKSIQQVLSNYYTVELEFMELQDYIKALQDKDYDLVLCQSDLPASEDPSWLYGPDGSVAGMDSIVLRGIKNYALNRVKLYNYHEIWYKPNETGRIDFMDKKNDFSKLIRETAADSPYIHLYLPYAALAYGDRVKGQSNPNKYDPYRGIEELWIWSGQ